MTVAEGDTLALPASFFGLFDDADSSRLSQCYASFLEGEQDSSSDFSIPCTEAGAFLRSAMALVEFYRTNWTGPRKGLPPAANDQLQALVVDGEYPYSQVLRPDLLLDAKMGFESLSFDQALLKKWKARAAFLHLRVMEGNLCPSLIKTVAAWTADSSGFTAEECLEAAIMMQACDQEVEAENLLTKAKDLNGMALELVGRLGRRTIHQSFDVYQLTVQIKSTTSSKVPCCSPTISAMPKSILLNDDHLRESVHYTGESAVTSISSLQRAILLAHATQQFRFHARDASTVDKITAFLDNVLEAPSVWQIYSSALFWRSKLETERLRTMERACLQLKALVEQVTSQSHPARLSYSFLSNFPTDWECEREEGMLFARLGAFKTALEIFERREMFDEAVQCLLNLGKVQDAQDLVLRRLSEHPNDARLICVLGEVKREFWNALLNDPKASDEAKQDAFQVCRDLFVKAWEVSGKRLARAQRSLGSVYYAIGEWTQVIASLSLAVAINPLFESSWFLLGLSAVQLENYPDAIRAFTRVITLNNDSPDAWKNLAFCHVKMNALDDAFRALKEVTRLHFDQIDGWIGLFSVALSVGEPLEAIKALQRYVEILQSSSKSFSGAEIVDILARLQQLNRLIQSVIRNSTSSCDSSVYIAPVVRHFHELIDFFMQTGLASSAEFWLLVAELLEGDDKGKERSEALMKAYRAMQGRPFDRDQTAFKLMINIVRRIQDEGDYLSQDDRESIKGSVKRRCREVFEETDEFKEFLQ